MKKNILLFLIITVLIVIVIISIMLVYLLQREKVADIKADNYNVNEEIDLGINKVVDKNEYFMVKKIVDNYFEVIKYINPNIEDIEERDLDGEDISSNEKRKKLLDSYTDWSITTIKNMIDKECIKYVGEDDKELANELKKYKAKNYTIEDMYYANENINMDVYYIAGIDSNNKKFKLVVKVDKYTETYSLYIEKYLEDNKIDENNFDEAFKIDKIEYINLNDNNIAEKIEVTDFEVASAYLNNWGMKIKENLQKSYNTLNEEYRNKRFDTYEKFENYINTSNKDYSSLKLETYSLEEENEKNVYVCKDQYENIYKFTETAVMEYTVQLDDYTIESNEYIEKYKKAKNQQKGILNIGRFFEMLNMQDYSSAYNLLDKNFRETYFKTQADFETFVKTYMFKYNNVTYKTYSDQISNLLIYGITLNDSTGENEKEVNCNIIMKLLENTNFVMSFEIVQ